MRGAETEKFAANERAALEDPRRLEERLGEVNTPTDVPEGLGEPQPAAPVEEGVGA